MNRGKRISERGTAWRVVIYTIALIWVFSTAWTLGWIVST